MGVSSALMKRCGSVAWGCCWGALCVDGGGGVLWTGVRCGVGAGVLICIWVPVGGSAIGGYVDPPSSPTLNPNQPPPQNKNTGWAFNYEPEGEFCRQLYASIPEKVDVLITHGPPAGVGDLTVKGVRAGGPVLLKYVPACRLSALPCVWFLVISR